MLCQIIAIKLIISISFFQILVIIQNTWASAPKDHGTLPPPRFFEALILIIGASPDLYFNYWCALPVFIVTGRLCPNIPKHSHTNFYHKYANK